MPKKCIACRFEQHGGKDVKEGEARCHHPQMLAKSGQGKLIDVDPGKKRPDWCPYPIEAAPTSPDPEMKKPPPPTGAKKAAKKAGTKVD